jgi:hypothetical protein
MIISVFHLPAMVMMALGLYNLFLFALLFIRLVQQYRVVCTKKIVSHDGMPCVRVVCNILCSTHVVHNARSVSLLAVSFSGSALLHGVTYCKNLPIANFPTILCFIYLIFAVF